MVQSSIRRGSEHSLIIVGFFSLEITLKLPHFIDYFKAVVLLSAGHESALFTSSACTGIEHRPHPLR